MIPYTLSVKAFPPDPLECPQAYWGVTLRRMLAYLIDVLLIGLTVLGLHLLLGMAAFVTFGLLGFLYALAVPVLAGLVALIYHVSCLSGPWCSTIGMRLLGLQAHHIDAGRPTLAQAFIHTICFYGTLGFGGGILLLIALFNVHRRTLHDMLAGLVILRRYSV